ncbi:MAG: CotH kinase family protein, partial [bacterium]|nr:CotH kinase family protein [bacterium]
MKAKKILSAVLAAAMLCSAAITVNGAENSQDVSSSVTSAAETGLYAHGVLGNSAETEAWQCWQWNDSKNCFYFYLPSGADDQKVELYNNSANQAEFDGTVIEPYSSATVSYSTTVSSTAKLNGSTNKVKFMKSTAEAAIYLNNLNADGNGTGLWEYLSNDKENSASATSAIIGSDGTVDNTAVKKIKGRGNTTWYKDKKPFNITFDARVSIAGMESGKKYSLLANYQDSSLSRNRFLYDLSDSVDMPYASDSRYVDFYVDGKYKGSYQAAQKIDTGKGSLLSDIDEAGYMNPDGTFAENFAFVCEVDASAGDADYYFNSDSGNKITLKTPELDYGAEYYDRVL